MLDPNPEVNVVGDKAWFGVLTWVQPEEEVENGDTQLVCGGPLLLLCFLTVLLVRGLLGLHKGARSGFNRQRRHRGDAQVSFVGGLFSILNACFLG